jgi:ATP-dependent DNA ligase
VRLSPPTPQASAPLDGSLDSILEAVRKHNLEGVIAKRADSIYEAGRRSLAWQKLPLTPKQEFVVGGYRPLGNTLELILVGYYANKKFMFAGKVRAGKVRGGLSPGHPPKASNDPQVPVRRPLPLR